MSVWMCVFPGTSSGSMATVTRIKWLLKMNRYNMGSKHVFSPIRLTSRQAGERKRFPSSSTVVGVSHPYTDTTRPLLDPKQNCVEKNPNQKPLWGPEIRSRLLPRITLAATQCLLSSTNHYNIMSCYWTEKVGTFQRDRPSGLEQYELTGGRIWSQNALSLFPSVTFSRWTAAMSRFLLSVSRWHSTRGIWTLRACEYIYTGI